MSLFLCNTSHHKPDVHEACRHETIVTAHHAEPFLERCTVVGCCHAAIEKVDYHTSHIAHGQTAAACFTHDAYAPVDIGRIAIVEIIRCLLGKVGACIKRLMTHQHAFHE